MANVASNRVICPDCRKTPPNIVEDFVNGDRICGDCGIVLGDRIIDTRSEWRTFDTESSSNPSRVGEATNIFDADPAAMNTLIAGKDGYVSSELGRVHVRVTGRGSSQMVEAVRDITALAERINIPKRIADDAKNIYRRAEMSKALKGRPRDAIVAASLYIACHQEKETARTFKEIHHMTHVKKKDLTQCYQEIKKIVGITSVSENASYIHRFCSNLRLPQHITKRVLDLCRRVTDDEIVQGKNPISIAGACIYLTAAASQQHRREYKEIAAVTGMTEPTIRSTCKALLESGRELLLEQTNPPQRPLD
ncbi:MAG: transcription initiation factor IIB [Amphiamblys sp. WSBS2006]|nr:MAG: transcription initiation factor IIB [Amphiamblys sp. WSBS2006]